MLLLKNGNVIDGRGNYLPRTSITMKDNRILRILAATESGIRLDPKAVVLDVKDMTVLPGFVDAHVHLLLNGAVTIEESLAGKTDYDLTITVMNNAKTAFRAGFTSVQDLGCRNGISIAVRNALADSKSEGPRIFACGSMICITGGHGHNIGGREADGADECRKAVREQVKQGADIIKLAVSGGVCTKGSNPNACEFTKEEVAALVDEAHSRGRKVAAHTHSDAAIRRSVEAGVDFIQHGSFASIETLELMAKQKTVLVPCMYSAVVQAEAETLAEYLREGCRPIVESHKRVMKLAKELGVTVALGSDGGTPLNYFGDGAKEFEYLAKRGFTSMEAIVAGTYNAAKAVGVEERLGSIEEGKIADMVVVDGNPLENIDLLHDSSRIVLIIKDGVIQFNKLAGSTKK